MRADRLLAVLALLQIHGKMTARALAERLEVSERTILRDMDALGTAGIPVYAERGSHGGWALPDGYRSKLTGMKSEELVSLLLANPSELLRDLGMQSHFGTALGKLLAAAPEAVRHSAAAARQRLHIDGAGWHQSDESCPCLPVVQEAVWDNRELTMHYPREAEMAERTVRPLGLVAKRGVWYLVAETDDGLRTYRVSRIRDARLLDRRFERPAGFSLAQYWELSTAQFKQRLPKYAARLRASPDALPRLERERYVSIIGVRPCDDGWADADVEFNTPESACAIILGLGALVEVTGPAELRAAVAAEARAIAARYGG